MKKTILLAVLATMCSLSAIGQWWWHRPQYFDECLYPKYFLQCYDTASAWGGVCGGDIGTALAQPFFIDSAVSIKGIAAILYHRPFTMQPKVPCYLQIRDASLNNVLAQIRYDTMVMVNQLNYPAVLFDSSITITDSLFYVTVTFEQNIYSHGVLSVRALGAAWQGYDTTCHNGDFPILVQHAGAWLPYYDFVIDIYGGYPSAVPFELLVFPILGTTPSSDKQVEIDIANTITLYPNPANSKVLIKGEGFDELKLYDVFGRLMRTQEVTSSETTIDIRQLKAGTYTLSVLKQGKQLCTKKVVKE